MQKILNKKFLGIIISLGFIIAIINQVDINKTIKSFGLMNPLFIIPIIPVYLTSFIIRSFRWRIFLHKKGLKFNSLLSSIFIGFSLNCILPARAGEIYRAYFFSKKENLDKTKVFTSVILERIFDGVTLFLILSIAIYLICAGKMFSQIALSAGMVFLGGFCFLLALAKIQKQGNKRKKIKFFILKTIGFLPEKIKNFSKRIINKVFSVLHSFIESLSTLDSWGLLAKTIFFSFLIWLMEGSAMFMVIKSFGLSIPFAGAMLVLTVTAFSSLIPAGPAGVGPYQWGYIIALGVFGIEPELGFAVSIINQLIAVLIVLSAGALFVWKEHIKLEEVNKNINNRQLSSDY